METPVPAPALVVLHGHDDDAASAAVIAESLGGTWRAVRTPEAPRDLTGARSWFDSGPRGADALTIARSRAAIRREIAACGAGPVVVAGFSQGAAMALSLGSADGADAVLAFCAFLPTSEEIDLSDGPPALLVSSEGDEVVPAFLAQDAAAAMVGAGREVTVEVLPGRHEVTVAAAQRAAAWLSRLPIGGRSSRRIFGA